MVDVLTRMPFNTACFVDSNADGKFDGVTPRDGMNLGITDLDTPLPYETHEVDLPGRDSWKYELLYQDVSQGTITLMYREFVRDLARPAFFQELVYELGAGPTTVSFRTMRIEILRASNNEIAYRILSGL